MTGVPAAMPITIEHVPSVRVVCVEHRGAYPAIGAAFERLGAWAASRGVEGRELAVFFDDPRATPEVDLRSWACVDIGAREGFDIADDPESGVAVRTIPGGRVAVAEFRGHYAGLPGAWAWLVQTWAPGRESIDERRGCVEVYLNHPSTTAPADLRTQLRLPLRG